MPITVPVTLSDELAAALRDGKVKPRETDLQTTTLMCAAITALDQGLKSNLAEAQALAKPPAAAATKNDTNLVEFNLSVYDRRRLENYKICGVAVYHNTTARQLADAIERATGIAALKQQLMCIGRDDKCIWNGYHQAVADGADEPIHKLGLVDGDYIDLYDADSSTKLDYKAG